MATRRWSSKRMRIRSGLFCGSIYWVLLVSGLVSVPKPLSQIQRSTRWLLQGLSPRTSFGGFGLRTNVNSLSPPRNPTRMALPGREKCSILDDENQSPGGLSGAAPPVPISNTEVKGPSADDTALATEWENRSLPGDCILLKPDQADGHG